MDEDTLPGASGQPAPLERAAISASQPPGASRPGHDLTGATLGGCRLIRKIAEGGMGEVYEALQLKLDRRVAVKLLTGRLALQPEFLQRFEREAKSAASLNHPGIVQVYDFGEDHGQFFFVMELVEGEDLSNHVKNHGKLPVAEALAVAEQTALALKAAAEKAIIHRDIKPANLLLTPEGRIKVSDLGLAKRLTDADVTVTGMTLGSPHFLAPEQADDARKADLRADIYSLGVTLLFLLTGRRPFEGASTFSLVLAHAQKPMPSGLELGTELPAAVEELIRRMTAKLPADRHQDYDALLADLQSVKAGFAPVAVIGRAWRDAQQETMQKQRRAVFASVTVSLLALVLAFAFWPRNPPPRQETSAPTASPNSPPAEPQRPPGPPDGPGPDEPRRMPKPGDGDFRGPPGKDRPGKGPLGGPGQNRRFLLPFPPLGRPAFNSLKDGPIEAMLAEAAAYATNNQGDFRGFIDRYHQLERKAGGTKWEAEVAERMDAAIGAHQQAVQKAIEEYRKRMQPFVAARQWQEAYNVWRDFPAGLRTREADDDIFGILDKVLPPDFERRE